MNLKNRISKLVKIYGNYKWQTLSVLIISIIIALIISVIPEVNRIIIDKVFTQKAEGIFIKLVMILLACYTFQFFLQTTVDYLINKMQMMFLYDKRISVLNALGSNETVIDEDISASYTFGRFNEINSIASLVSTTVIKFLISIFTLIFSIIYLYKLDPFLIVMLIFITPIYYFFAKISLKGIGVYTRKILEINSFTYCLYTTFFKGVNSLKMNNYTTQYIDKIKLRLNDSFFKGLKQGRLFALGQNTISFSVSIASLIFLVYFGLNIMDSNLTIGDYVASLQYVAYIFLPFTLWGTFELTVEPAFVALDRVDEAFFRKETNKDDVMIECIKIVQFNNVNYQGRISQKHSQIFKSGKTNYIEGGNGYGKSTIFKLISKIYTPDCGELTINGQNINTIDSNNLWSLISYCPQDDFLFEGTVLENICLSNKYSLVKFTEILKSMNLEDLLGDVALDYEVASEGGNLSGGQRKKVAFLRSVIKESDLYMFDEPYEGLDKESKKIVYKYIENLSNKKIVIVTSHIDQV